MGLSEVTRTSLIEAEAKFWLTQTSPDEGRTSPDKVVWLRWITPD
jgi:hypothetical protein